MSLGSIQWGSAFSMSLFASAFQVKSRDGEESATTQPPAEEQAGPGTTNTTDTLTLTTEAEENQEDSQPRDKEAEKSEKHHQRHHRGGERRGGSVSIDAAAFSYRTQSLFGNRGPQGGSNMGMSLASMVVERGRDTLELSEESLKEQEESDKTLSEKMVEMNEGETAPAEEEATAGVAPETEPTEGVEVEGQETPAPTATEPGSGSEEATPSENAPEGLASLFSPEMVGAFFSGEASFEEEITTALGIESNMGRMEYEMSAAEDGFHFSMVAGSSSMSLTEDGFESSFSGRAIDVGLHKTEDGGIEMTFTQVTRTQTMTVSHPGRGRGHGRPVEGQPHPSQGKVPPPKPGKGEIPPEQAPPAEEPPQAEETGSGEAVSTEDGEEAPPAESPDTGTSDNSSTIGDIFEAIDGILAGLMSLTESSGGSIEQSMTSEETAFAFGPFAFSSSTTTESTRITLPEGAWSELFASGGSIAPEEPSPEEVQQQNGLPDVENQQIVAPMPEAVVPKQPPATTLDAEEESAEDQADDDEEQIEPTEMVA